jgi:hypothetical protein
MQWEIESTGKMLMTMMYDGLNIKDCDVDFGCWVTG